MELTKEEMQTIFNLLHSTWEKRPLTDEEAILYIRIKQLL